MDNSVPFVIITSPFPPRDAYPNSFMKTFLPLSLGALALLASGCATPGAAPKSAAIPPAQPVQTWVLAQPVIAPLSSPRSIAIDQAGNLYIANVDDATIHKISMNGEDVVLGGLAVGGAAGLSTPSGVAVGATGVVYVANTDDQIICKISPDGKLMVLAGLSGNAGDTDGTGAAARFSTPTSVAVDGAGNVYVADNGSAIVRKITPAGVVTTLAGKAGAGGGVDGTGAAARFNTPRGIAVDGAGNVYVADEGNADIREITPAGVVTTLAGSDGRPGYRDGAGTAAKFGSPRGLTVDATGTVYVADTDNDVIRKITPDGTVSTVAGTAGEVGTTDGTGAAARFSAPRGIAVDAAGNLYVADSDNAIIRRITPAGVVTTIIKPGT
jgi:sugar lactone lactonase YvrE